MVNLAVLSASCFINKSLLFTIQYYKLSHLGFFSLYIFKVNCYIVWPCCPVGVHLYCSLCLAAKSVHT